MPRRVQTDARASPFTEAFPEHDHELSHIGGERAHEHISHRQLLDVCKHVHERPVPLTEILRDTYIARGTGEGRGGTGVQQ